MNGLQVAVKQLRAGPCDLAIAEQLLMEEAALMQVCRLTLRFESKKLRLCAGSGSTIQLFCTYLDARAALGSHSRWLWSSVMEDLCLNASTGNSPAAPRRFLSVSLMECHIVTASFFRQSAPLPLDFVLTVMKSVCSAVAYAHDSAVIHRDIKPGNVLLTSSGGVKLCDFGLSRRLPDSAAPMTQGIGTPQVIEDILSPSRHVSHDCAVYGARASARRNNLRQQG